MDGKNGHLWLMHDHMTRHDYRLHNPGAPLFTSQRIAKQCGIDVQTVMANLANEYATPEERAAADKDPKYDAHTPYVICRISRCGFKARSLTKHLRNVHDISGKEAVEAYRREHNWCPIHCQEVRTGSSTRNSQRLAKLKAQVTQQAAAGTKVAIAVNDAIPRFERLFSAPEIKQNPKLLLTGWQHPNFTWDEIRAAREAYMGRTTKAKWPILAARWYVALTTNYDVNTVRRYHNRYLNTV